MRNSDLIREVYAAFGRGDVPAVLAAFDPAIEWLEAESFPYAAGNPYVGPAAVAEGIFMRVVGDVDGFAVLPQRVIDGGDTVVVEGRYRGTAKATGIAIDAQFVHVWQLAGGKITTFRQYTDTKQWADAFGAMGV